MEFNTKKIKSTWKRSLFGDFDGDGVMNAFDCQPKNKRKQDTDKESLKEQLKRIQEEQMEDTKEKPKEYTEEERANLDEVSNFLKKIGMQQ